MDGHSGTALPYLRLDRWIDFGIDFGVRFHPGSHVEPSPSLSYPRSIQSRLIGRLLLVRPLTGAGGSLISPDTRSAAKAVDGVRAPLVASWDGETPLGTAALEIPGIMPVVR